MNMRIVLAAALAVGVTACARAEPPAPVSTPIRVSADPLAGLVAESLSHAYVAGREGASVKTVPAGDADVWLSCGELTDARRAELAKVLGEANADESARKVGRFVVAVVVHSDNPTTRLNLEQLRNILGGLSVRWSELDGTAYDAEAIAVYLPPADAPASRAAAAMLGSEKKEESKPGSKPAAKSSLTFTARATRCGTLAEVAARVAKDPAGIGLVAVTDPSAPPAGVKRIAVAVGEEAALPDRAGLFAGSYPLSMPVSAWANPKSEAGVAFCEYLTSGAAESSLQQLGLLPGGWMNRAEAKRTLDSLPANRAGNVRATGIASAADLMAELNLDYVIAGKRVRVDYRGGSQSGAVGGLLLGQELALLEGPFEPVTQRVYGRRWERLGPKAYDVGARATAIIVHPSNRLTGLSIDQAAALFSGEVDDWRLLQGLRDALPVRCYAPKDRGAAWEIFNNKVVDWKRCRRVVLKPNDAAVVAAVAADKGGIAFVDFASLPAECRDVRAAGIGGAGGATGTIDTNYAIGGGGADELDGPGSPAVEPPPVKVLAIGPMEKMVFPSRQSANDGGYPLSRKVTLFASPKASEEATAFAKFAAMDRRSRRSLLSCGVLPSFALEQAETLAAERRKELVARAAEARSAAEQARIEAESNRIWAATAGKLLIDENFAGDLSDDWDLDKRFGRVQLDDGTSVLRSKRHFGWVHAIHRESLPARVDIRAEVAGDRKAGNEYLYVAFHSSAYRLAYTRKGLELKRGRKRDVIARADVPWTEDVHRLRITDDGAGNIDVFWDDLMRPAIRVREGEQYVGGKGGRVAFGSGGGTVVTVHSLRATSPPADEGAEPSAGK